MMTNDERAELEHLRRWKAEATEVILGLQDVGKALGLGPGERITGETATEAAKRLSVGAEAAERALASIESLAKVQAASCAAMHRADIGRNWLDVLAIIERAPLTGDA